MSAPVIPVTDGDQVYKELKAALQGPNARIHLVETLTHGRAAQVFVKSRKVGPLLFPASGEDLSDVLHLLGQLAVAR